MHKYTRKHSFFILLILCWPALLYGQDPIRFQNISVNDGLSMGTITAFAKDYNGYIWIGTAEGLHRYDGQKFKIYKQNQKSEDGLSDSYVTCLLSHNQKLYIGTNLGVLDILNNTTGNFYHVDLQSIDTSFDNAIEQIVEYKNTIIIDTDGGGLWQYFPNKHRLRKIELTHFENVEIHEMLVASDMLYLLTSRQIIETNLNHTKSIISDKNISFTCFDKNKNDFIIGSKTGVYKWSGDNNSFDKIELPPKKRLLNQVNTIESDQENIWIGTSGGLVKIKNNDVSLYKNNQLRPYSLVNNQVRELFIDNENIVWVGTISGISKYAPQLNKFGLLQYFDHQGKSYNNNVYNIYEDNDHTIWLGTLTSGLIKLNRQNRIDHVYSELVSNEVSTHSVRCMLEDSKDRFWIGTRDEGLFLFNKNTGETTHIANRNNGKLNTNIIRNIYEDTDGLIWIGTQDGISLKDSQSHTFSHYKADTVHRNNSIYQIIEHPKEDKLILASFRGGLQIFDKKTKKFAVFKHNPSDTQSISNNNLMSLELMNNDSLLIGTYGGGLNILDLNTMKFTSITEYNGLINNSVYGVLYEGNGSCWLSTNYGLVNYNIHTHSFINFSPVHYLQSTEFNEGAFLKSSNGQYYFGGVNGINFFEPQNIKYNTKSAPIYFTDVRGKLDYRGDKLLNMSFLNSRLEIDFMALYYINPIGVKYHYKLIGYDNDWVPCNKNNTAVYPRLGPGSYSFEVKAEDEFGNWSSKSKEFKILVTPPLWQRWWFIALCILAFLAILYAIFRYRTREIERYYKLQMVDSELAALRSQMNPHFIFNSLNSIQYFILKKEPKEAYTYLSKFASLMRKILQNSRLKYISVADEIEGLNLYLEMEKMRMDGNLTYTIKTKNIEDETAVNIPTMLIQPFVENSIVHGLLPKKNNRQLDILISQEKSHFLCTITDNGIGREASRSMNEKRSSKHKSAGMALTQKRLKILSEGKGEFDVNIEDLLSTEGLTGTKVKLLIPIITETG